MSPWLMAPMTNTMGPVLGSSFGSAKGSMRRAPASNPMMGAPTGRWSVMGLRMTFSSVSDESAARTFILCSS